MGGRDGPEEGEKDSGRRGLAQPIQGRLRRLVLAALAVGTHSEQWEGPMEG